MRPGWLIKTYPRVYERVHAFKILTFSKFKLRRSQSARVMPNQTSSVFLHFFGHFLKKSFSVKVLIKFPAEAIPNVSFSEKPRKIGKINENKILKKSTFRNVSRALTRTIELKYLQKICFRMLYQKIFVFDF